jgi:hypothetical protein
MEFDRGFPILREIRETRDSPWLYLVGVECIVNGLLLASCNSGFGDRR